MYIDNITNLIGDTNMKYISCIILVVISCFYLSNIISAGTIDPKNQDSVYIKHAERFDCVGRLCGKYEDGSMFCASAVAISDRWIITAAHVVKDSKECFIFINDKKICVTEFIYKKEFDLDEVGMNDIAVGKCSEDIGLKNYPALYDAQDEKNKFCDISGFGITGTFESGAKKLDNKKRAGTNYVEDIFKHTLVCNASKETCKTYTQKEFLIASGDSGGGLFIDNKLAGINSFIMSSGKSPDASYSSESCHTRISIFKKWIEEVIK